jgi:putative transposase
MPRQPRYNIAGGVYHVTQRGVEQRDIVRDENDRMEWLRLLGRNATRCGWQVFAYALLTNHFHIFLKTPQPNLSEGMQAFESGFVTLFNKQHNRVGPLFQGRFGAVLVEQESYGRVLSRYVHLNPLHAGLTQQPGQYRWSSYQHYLDPRKAPVWLEWKAILAEFSNRESAARIAYRRFVEEGGAAATNPLDDVKDGWLLGSEAFVSRYRQLEAGADWLVESGSTASLQITPERLLISVSSTFGVSQESVLRRGRRNNIVRDLLIWLDREATGSSLQELGNRYKVGASSICEATRRAAEKLRSKHELRNTMESIRANLGSGQALQTSIEESG